MYHVLYRGNNCAGEGPETGKYSTNSGKLPDTINNNQTDVAVKIV